jgi:hypothetical protein
VSQRESGTRRISLDLSEMLLSQLDSLKAELGLRSRGAIVERLLGQLFDVDDDESQDDEEQPIRSEGESRGSEASNQEPTQSAGDLNEDTAIVLIRSDLVSLQDQDCVPAETVNTDDWCRVADLETGPARTGRGRRSDRPGGGIQLPGFVQRQSHELKRSLHPPQRASESDRSLALISAHDLHAALEAARHHWLEIYGQPPSDPVLEAAMIWLARDIWPQSDQSDGRPFTWSLTQQVVSAVAPDWADAEASLERVITAAGILEDPFSGATLALRVPTLITRFVQRVRTRQKRKASFQAIDQTMTIHAALKLLQLPTVADRPYSLNEIREAYREQALSHHPDAGGSPEAMRRLNEAYQFLKERYRRND